MSESNNNFLLTGVLPSELPLIYSNTSLYKFIDSYSEWRNSTISYEEVSINVRPFNYYVKKNNGEKRELSLPHPLSQLVYTKFINHFDDELLHYFKINGVFSIRYPSRIYTSSKIDKYKQTDFYRFQKELKGFFSYPYPKISDFYNSKLFSALELEFKHLSKLDIQSCFDSIYTHSIEWAYIGSKKLSKKWFRNGNNKSNNLGKILDRVLQCSNDVETNGILVGPEFSRISAEIILSHIDDNVYRELSKIGLVRKKDYQIVRYIDDIFIFTDEINVAELIQEVFAEELKEFKLKINFLKKFEEERPFLKEHNWVGAVQELNDKLESFILLDGPQPKDRFESRSARQVSIYIDLLKDLIVRYEKQSNYIITYIITTLSRIIYKYLNSLDNISESIEISLIKDDMIGKERAIDIRIEKIIDFLVLALVLNPTSKNSINFCKICFELIKYDERYENIIYLKIIQLAKNDDFLSTELVNIFVLARFLKRDLPEEILISILGDKINYLNFMVVSFYLLENQRRNKYQKVKSIINEYIKDSISSLNEIAIPGPRTRMYTDHDFGKILKSRSLVILHDFSTYPALSNSLKTEIKDLFDTIKLTFQSQNVIDRLNKKPVIKAYCEYLITSKKGQIDWDCDQTEVESIINIVVNTKLDRAY